MTTTENLLEPWAGGLRPWARRGSEAQPQQVSRRTPRTTVALPTAGARPQGCLRGRGQLPRVSARARAPVRLRSQVLGIPEVSAGIEGPALTEPGGAKGSSRFWGLTSQAQQHGSSLREGWVSLGRGRGGTARWVPEGSGRGPGRAWAGGIPLPWGLGRTRTPPRTPLPGSAPAPFRPFVRAEFDVLFFVSEVETRAWAASPPTFPNAYWWSLPFLPRPLGPSMSACVLSPCHCHAVQNTFHLLPGVLGEGAARFARV